MSFRRRSVARAACVLLTVSTVALASDTKYFQGSMCTFAVAGDYDGQSRSLPKFGNTSGEERSVICPFITDTEGDIEYAYVVASSSVDEDTCVLRLRGYAGSDLGWWAHDSVTSVATGVNRTAFFTGATTADTSSGDTYAITCDLPNQAIVFSYSLTEP